MYIFDLDGTIADLTHRYHYINNDNPDWDAFYDACDKDEPIKDVIDVLVNLYKAGETIYIVSGRSDQCKAKTQKWLADNKIPYFVLYMRKKGDHRPDDEVKQEWLDYWLEHHKKEEIKGVFEDRKRVVDMWRKNGITCYQMKDGNY